MHKHTLIASTIAALLASLGTAYAAENSGGSNPPTTSAPTHTVPVTAPHKLVIKTKSSPPRSDNPSKPPIEERKGPIHQPNCGPTMPGDPKTSTC